MWFRDLSRSIQDSWTRWREELRRKQEEHRRELEARKRILNSVQPVFNFQTFPQFDYLQDSESFYDFVIRPRTGDTSRASKRIGSTLATTRYDGTTSLNSARRRDDINLMTTLRLPSALPVASSTHITDSSKNYRTQQNIRLKKGLKKERSTFLPPIESLSPPWSDKQKMKINYNF